jgi:hypothetical protein
MATYLQGVTDFIPDYQPFQPDFNFYANVLQAKQTQYDTNYKAVNNLYGQLYNADLTHDLNITKKDELLKQIDFNLKRVSGLDLSLEQNIDQATQVFRPFYEDRYLMKDMAWTKNFSATYNSAAALKNSQDEKKRGQYWEPGMKDMQYRREEFKNATLDETLNMGNVSYTPYVDAGEKYRKMAEEWGLEIDTTTVDESGLYFVRQRNGQPLIPALQKLFVNVYANDPSIQAKYATEAYVKRKDYASQNADKYGGDQNTAEKQYLQEQYTWLNTYTAERAKKDAEDFAVTDSKAKSVERDKQDGNVNPKQDSYYDQLTQALGIEKTAKDQSEKIHKEVSSGAVSYPDANGVPEGLDLSNIELARLKVDAGVASVLAEQGIIGAADIYAYKKHLIEYKANPVGLEGLRHQNAIARLDYTHQLKTQEIGMKDKLDRDRDRIKYNISTGYMVYDENNEPIINPIYAGEFVEPGGSGQVGEEVNISKLNEESFSNSSAQLTSGFIDHWFMDMSNLISTGAITEQEVWKMIKLTPYGEVDNKGEATSGYQAFWNLNGRYKKDKEKVKRDLTSSNKVLSMKSGFDGWVGKNDAHSVADAYLKRKEGIKIQRYAFMQDQYYALEEENDEKMIKTLDKSISGASFNDDIKKQLTDLFRRGMMDAEGMSQETFVRLATKVIGKNDEQRPIPKGGSWVDNGMQNLTEKEWTVFEQRMKDANKKKGHLQRGEIRASSEYPNLSGREIGNIRRAYVGEVYGVDPSSGTPDRSAQIEVLYNNMLSSYGDLVTDPNPETGLTSVIPVVANPKTGRAAVAADSSSRMVNLSVPHAPGTKAFIETYADIMRINWNQDNTKYKVSINGLEKGDEAEDADFAKALMGEYMSSLKSGGKSQPFKISQSQVALESRQLNSVTVFPTMDFLKKNITSVTVDGEITTDKTEVATKIDQIYKNGISFIAPKGEWSNSFTASNRPTVAETILNRKGEIKYTDPSQSGNYNITKVTDVPGVDYNINYTLIGMDDNGNKITRSAIPKYVNRGNNIDDAEDDIYNRILTVANINLELYRKFHQQGNQEAIANANKNFGFTPKMAGFNY